MSNKVTLPFPPATTVRAEYEYNRLVNNLAVLLVNQCNLFARQVPDTIAKDYKAGRLCADVIKVIQEQL